MAILLPAVPLTVFLLFNHYLAWGWPWRPRRLDDMPETRMEKWQRALASGVTLLGIANVWLLFLVVGRIADR